jgi:integrase
VKLSTGTVDRKQAEKAMQADDDARKARRPDLYAGALDQARQRLPAVEGAPSVQPTPAVSLRGIFEAWARVAVLKPRTVRETGYALNALVAFVGHDDAAKLTRVDLVRWRDALKADGVTNNTWNNRLSMLRQVFAFGASEGTIKANPADGLCLRKNRQQSPLPYTEDDATRILLAARKETRPSLRWSRWIMGFSGMRAGEVLQLLGGDVRQEGDIWLIDINETTEGKSMKTGQRRFVPIHPALVREGFVAYAGTIATDTPLFPDIPTDAHGNRGGRAWEVIGRWVRDTVGITDPSKAPDHSWRHRIEDELRDAEVPEDARDAILGHARKTTGRQYGVRGEALTRLHRCLSLVPVPRGLA